MTILITDKVDFRAKKITRGREGQHIIIKGLLFQEGVADLHMQQTTEPQNVWSKKWHNWNGDTDKYNSTITVGDLTTPLSTIDRTTGQKINKDIVKFKTSTTPIGLETFIEYSN